VGATAGIDEALVAAHGAAEVRGKVANVVSGVP